MTIDSIRPLAATVALSSAVALCLAPTVRVQPDSPRRASGVTNARASSSAAAKSARTTRGFRERPDGTIISDGHTFQSWGAYVGSALFRERARRCGTPAVPDAPDGAPAGADGEGGIAGGSTSDCTLNLTSPLAIYDPTIVHYRIPVVVHVIQSSTGQGYVSPTMIQSQIDVLNEDFLALPLTLGQSGTDVQIEFYLATGDPSGNPTTGITYTTNTSWFNETSTGFFSALNWDTDRYLNIYTNTASGQLGYATIAQSSAGATADGVVILYQAFGRNAPIGAPYNMGRTTTHEVGHYLGLFHTFQSNCGTTSSPGCFSTGDRICDTNGESTWHFGCPSINTCSGDAGNDPVQNYMAYTDDACMTHFTPQQARRMRCTLEHWRPDLYEIVVAPPPCPADLTGDNFVNVGDLLALIGTWGPCPGCPGDLNDDNAVNVADLLELIGAWGDC